MKAYDDDTGEEVTPRASGTRWSLAASRAARVATTRPPRADGSLFPSDADPTRDLAHDLAGFRDRREPEEAHDSPKARSARIALVPDEDWTDGATRFFVVERDVIEAAESALATLTNRRTLRSAVFGLYVYGRHDARGLHVGGRRVDLSGLAKPLAALRTTTSTASFELRIAPLVIFGSTGPLTGCTVLTAADAPENVEGARGISTSFSRLFHAAMHTRRSRTPMEASRCP